MTDQELIDAFALVPNTLDDDLIQAFNLLDKKSAYRWLDDKEKLPPFKATYRGRMEVPLNRETHEGMQAGTFFIQQWRTQAHLIMAVDRLFQAELYMYEVGTEKVKHRIVAQMIDPDNANVLWKAIDEMSKYVMTLDAEKDTVWNVDKCKAVVRV